MENMVLNICSKLTELKIDSLENELADKFAKSIDRKTSTQFFFNLSQVRFVQLQAAAKLVLVIARCMEQTEKPVLIALPTIGLTEKEKRAFDSKSVQEQNVIKGLAESRNRANSFFKTIGFDKVLDDIAQTIQGASVLLTEAFDYAALVTDSELKNSIHTAFNRRPLDATLRDTSGYKCIYPLTWIECRSDSNSEFKWNELIFDDVERILGHPDKGLDPLDVEAIKNVVLPELIKNVYEHSHKSHALLTIGLIDSQSLIKEGAPSSSTKKRKKAKVTHNIEMPYLQWLLDNQGKDARTDSQVEIYFGDIGTGILTDDLEKKYTEDNADSGKQKICPSVENLMQWVNSRWAAQKTRLGADGNCLSEQRSGTKGLYRIRRIIRKYAGVFHITTTNQDGNIFDSIYREFGLQKREHDWEFSEQQQQGFAGTLIQIKMCPFARSTHFRFVLDSGPSSIEWKFWHYKIEQGASLDSEFSEKCIAERIKHIQLNRHSRGRSADGLSIVLLLDLSLLKEKEGEDPWRKAKEFIDKRFEYLSLYGHPASIVVVLSQKTMSNGELDDQLRSLTDRLSENINNAQEQLQRNRDNEHYYAPVMIIGEDRKVFWFGGHKASIAFLNKVTTQIAQANQKTFYDVLYEDDSFTSQEKKRIAHVLHADSCPECLYHFQNITQSFEKEINQHDAQKTGVFCSPSLEITKNWFDVGSFFNDQLNNNALKYAWLFSLKADEFLRITMSQDEFNYHNAYLLIDHSHQQQMALEFARLTGIPWENIKNLEQDVDPSVPHRGKLFPKGASVIMMTTIISSSETARRLIKFVRRDSAYPVLLLCLYNRRIGDQTYQEELETWGEQTRILSIATAPFSSERTVACKKNEKDARVMKDTWNSLEKYFDVRTGSQKKPNAVEVRSPRGEYEKYKDVQPRDWEMLCDWISHARALHYSHVGIFKSRHFTFYLDKRKLLEYTYTDTKSNPAWERLDSWISDWIKTYQIESDIAVCIPDNLFRDDSENSPFYKHLNDLYGKRIKVLKSGHLKKTRLWTEKNIVYFDFGTLTGETVAEVADMAQANGVRNLLVCILFKQTQSSLVRFFEHVYYLTPELSGDLPKSFINTEDLSTVDQVPRMTTLTLPGFEDMRSQLRPECMPPMRLVVRYLFDFPLTYFTSELCPICEHQKALERYKIDSPYLGQFSDDRQRRLKLRSVSEIAQRESFDFYWSRGSEGHEMSPALIWRMFSFKFMLENAENSTHARIKLFNYLHSIYVDKAMQYKDPDSDLYAVLFFLAHEVYWFQREPLTFKKFRVLLTQISRKIVVCKLSSLVEIFNDVQLQLAGTDFSVEGMPSEEVSRKQATRYKYSAISVLRSSNKMIFCRTVRLMLKSTAHSIIVSNKKDSKDDLGTNLIFGNNLVQNIFYHIASLCQNKYNSSIEYFNILEEQLPDEEIRGIESCCFSIEQQIAGVELRRQIQKAKCFIRFPSKSRLDDIRQLKGYFAQYETMSHPTPCVNFHNFSINSDIVEWRLVMGFLDRILWFCKRNSLAYFPDDLTILDQTAWYRAEDAIKKINAMVRLNVKENASTLSENSEFLSNLRTIDDFFIKIKKRYNATEDSKIKEWVDDMVTDFQQVVDKIFPVEEFPKRCCSGAMNTLFFFPFSNLCKCLRHIKRNMKKRLYSGKEFRDVKLDISAENKSTGCIEILIKYDLTATEAETMHRGELSFWRDNFIYFGGSLNWEQPSSKNSDFTITMRFEPYEK